MNEIEKDLEGRKAKLIFQDQEKASKKYIVVKKVTPSFLCFQNQRNGATEVMPSSRIIRLVEKNQENRREDNYEDR